jgi:phosphate transport system protein
MVGQFGQIEWIDMATHFEQELAALQEKLLTMASHAETAVQRAVSALIDRDENNAAKVKEDDTILDQFEIDVDEIAIHLLARAPRASLRFITTAMKISHDLERAGDEATTIARRTIELNQEPQLKPYLDIPRMASLALEMLKEAMGSFADRMAARARAVIPRDKQVDVLNKQLHRELASFMVEDPATITRCLHLMVVSKSLERIADHATNIAEEVVYLCEGHDIRHDPQMKRPVAAAPPR